MTAQHSAGPWVVGNSDGYGETPGVKVNDGHYTIALAIEDVGELHQIAKANAYLIASAPDLLAALQDMLSGWRYIRRIHGDLYGVGWDRAQDAAEAAIAAATGDAP